MYVCICVYVYMCVCIYMYVCVDVYIFKFVKKQNRNPEQEHMNEQ